VHSLVLAANADDVFLAVLPHYLIVLASWPSQQAQSMADGSNHVAGTAAQGAMHGQYCVRNLAAEIGVVDGAACTPCRTGPAIRELNADGVVGSGQAIVRRLEGAVVVVLRA
jgi:hypothetical protein